MEYWNVQAYQIEPFNSHRNSMHRLYIERGFFKYTQFQICTFSLFAIFCFYTYAFFCWFARVNANEPNSFVFFDHRHNMSKFDYSCSHGVNIHFYNKFIRSFIFLNTFAANQFVCQYSFVNVYMIQMHLHREYVHLIAPL